MKRELIKKIIKALASTDSHYLFAIGPDDKTVAEQLIEKVLEKEGINIEE